MSGPARDKTGRSGASDPKRLPDLSVSPSGNQGVHLAASSFKVDGQSGGARLSFGHWWRIRRHHLQTPSR